MTEWLSANGMWAGPLALGVSWVAFQVLRGALASAAEADKETNWLDHLVAGLKNVKPWGKP